MAGAGEPRRHAHEDELLAYATKHLIYAASVRELAEWLQREYPGSCTRLLPPLRDLYRERALKERQ